MGQTISAWIEQASGPALTVPAFMTMDGAYVAAPAAQEGEVARWCGWLRLEGHGTFALRMTEAHVGTITGEWEVVDAETARLTLHLRDDLPSSARPPFASLLLVEGNDADSVDLRLDDGGAGGQEHGCRMAFEPEEMGDESY